MLSPSIPGSPVCIQRAEAGAGGGGGGADRRVPGHIRDLLRGVPPQQEPARCGGAGPRLRRRGGRRREPGHTQAAGSSPLVGVNEAAGEQGGGGGGAAAAEERGLPVGDSGAEGGAAGDCLRRVRVLAGAVGLLHVVRARRQRRLQRHRAARRRALHPARWRRHRRGGGDPQRRPRVGRLRHRGGADDVGLPGDRHHREEDHGADADEGLRGGVRRRLGGGGGVEARPADLRHPHARRRRDGRGLREGPQQRPLRDGAGDRRLVAGHHPRRRPALRALHLGHHQAPLLPPLKNEPERREADDDDESFPPFRNTARVVHGVGG